MSTLTNLINYGTDYQIGEVVNVLVGDSDSGAIPTLISGGFIKCGATYNQADYPELYAKLGNVNAERYKLGPHVYTNKILYGNSVYLSFAGPRIGAAYVYVSTNLDTWTLSGPFPSSIIDIAYGNGVFVVSCSNSNSYWSTNGVNWTVSSSILGFIAFNGTEFISVLGSGSGNTIRKSTDGISWTSIGTTSFSTDNVYDFTFTNNQYILVKETSIYTSATGLSWTNVSNTGGNSRIAYGNNKYVLRSSFGNYHLMHSSDLVTWTIASIIPAPFNNPSGLRPFVFDTNNNIFLAFSGSYGMYSSVDGAAWALISNEVTSFYYMTYVNGWLICTDYDTNSYRTTNVLNRLYTDLYDTNTQFYVPDYTLTTAITLSGWTNPRTGAQWQTYIKAK